MSVGIAGTVYARRTTAAKCLAHQRVFAVRSRRTTRDGITDRRATEFGCDSYGGDVTRSSLKRAARRNSVTDFGPQLFELRHVLL
jgi:hypothetical protein